MHTKRHPFARLREQSGQAIVFSVLALVPLIALVGFVVDVGMAYRTQRALQASADAAALAGAQLLPDATLAVSTARTYGAGSGRENEIRDVTVDESVATSCITTIPGCRPVNAVSVDESATVPTLFAKIVGINTLQIRAHATACSPCGAKTLDIMLVLDRTGSMCQDSYGNSDPLCTDLNNARAGIRTFLGYFSPGSALVGLAVLPPASSILNRCATPSTSNYNSSSSPYVIVPLSSDFRLADGSLNPASDLITTLNCVKGAGNTAYANAIEAAQAELDAHGRPAVPDIIVFMSDGAANIGPTYYATTSPYRRQPCHQGVTSAGVEKARSTIIYSIGYALDDDTGGCKSYTGSAESPAITVYDALRGIASAPDKFLIKPSPGDLQAIYASIAQDLSQGSSSLIG
jgi:hypothetical protein